MLEWMSPRADVRSRVVIEDAVARVEMLSPLRPKVHVAAWSTAGTYIAEKDLVSMRFLCQALKVPRGVDTRLIKTPFRIQLLWIVAARNAHSTTNPENRHLNLPPHQLQYTF